MNQYFDYDDYLEFLQLFTRVIYEKLTGEEMEAKPTDDQSQGSSEQVAGLVENQQIQERFPEPARKQHCFHRIDHAEGKLGNIDCKNRSRPGHCPMVSQNQSVHPI